MLFKLKFFEISCSEVERDKLGIRTLVSHEHRKRVGRCIFDNLDDITYDNPTLHAICVAPFEANVLITNINNRLSWWTGCDAYKFDYNCPFLRGLGLDLCENGFVRPDDELPNIYSELLEALKGAVAGSHMKIVTMETNLYVHSSFTDYDQFCNNIRNLHRPISEHAIGVSKVSISHPKESLRDTSIGDSLELLTMRLRQRVCAICHADTDDIMSESRITCLPCSHLYHEDCISLWLMRKSSCPLCKYRISFDEVECQLPCDWPRRHRRNGPNFLKIVTRLACKIQRSYLAKLICCASPVLFPILLVYCDGLKRIDKKYKTDGRADPDRQSKEFVKKLAKKELQFRCLTLRFLVHCAPELSENFFYTSPILYPGY